jgi:hypothetical protein
MAEKKKKQIKVGDLKPSKDAKGGGAVRNQGTHQLDGGTHNLDAGRHNLNAPAGGKPLN